MHRFNQQIQRNLRIDFFLDKKKEAEEETVGTDTSGDVLFSIFPF